MLNGSCLCGAITYEVHSALGPIVMCHCAKCRKANGSAFATNAPIKAQDFKLVSGENVLAEYESTPGVFRVFCRNCSSPLYSKRRSLPEIIRLRIGTLDTPIVSKPSAHIFVGSKAEWYEILDDLPQHAERPS
ncbi:MAG: GFA family protein [Gammaproteobacteria bacterium]|nr:GFA family protein [Gammaproteobacteria bacterium]